MHRRANSPDYAQRPSIAYLRAQQDNNNNNSNQRNSNLNKICRTCEQSKSSRLSMQAYRKPIGNVASGSAVSESVYSGAYDTHSVSHSVYSANNKLDLIINGSQSKVSPKHNSLPATNLPNKLPTTTATTTAAAAAATTTTSTVATRAYFSVPVFAFATPFERRAASHSTAIGPSAFGSPASMLLPYQINQRATLLQATQTATTIATATAVPHVPKATTTTRNTLHAAHRIFNRDTVRTATNASPLTPQQQQQQSTTTSTTTITTPTTARIEFILYTELYEEDSDIDTNSANKQNFWHKY
ncbi:PREDICTED: cell wall integrity and stress response component 4, partial [Drosophila arizonae]|uniref:Cell wall integrity and stress response component 4 n=1 Tax=Drosophila arizonae TaxID=7263 RepID=A0ABM1PZT0_DROAR